MKGSLSSFSDEKLISRLADGEIESLGELYRRYIVLVRFMLARVAINVRDEELEELSQDVFLAVRDSAGKFRGRSSFKSWLYGIVINRARNYSRSSWLRRKLLKSQGSLGSGTAVQTRTSPAQTIELRQQIERTLNCLNRGQREVLLLHAQGYSGEEIADILGIRAKTVWTRIHRARKILLERHPGAELRTSLAEGEAAR